MAKSEEEKNVEATEVAQLRDLVEGLKKQVGILSGAARGGSTLRKRTKDHFVTMREYVEDDKVLGVVVNLYDVKEVKDPTENKRFYGLCKLDVLDPRTEKVKTYKDVNYLEFLNNTKRVQAKVVKWEKTERAETDPRRGGGGSGSLVKQTLSNSYVSDELIDFEVVFIDHSFELEFTEGEFEGLKVTIDEKGLNI